MQKVLCLAILVCLSSTAQGGWVFKQTQQDPWGNSEETHLFQGNKLATKGEWLRIVDLSSGTASIAIPDQKIFGSNPAGEYLASLKNAGMSSGEDWGEYSPKIRIQKAGGVNNVAGCVCERFRVSDESGPLMEIWAAFSC